MDHQEAQTVRIDLEWRVEQKKKWLEEGRDLWTGKLLAHPTPHAKFDSQSRGMGIKEYKRREKLRKRKLHRRKKAVRAAKPPESHPDIIGATVSDVP